jgi:sulfatase maturation enzyme AslB (radical SAM superfamily)
LKYPKEKMNIIWHGGEVCLLGAEYFYKTIHFLEKYCKNTKNRIKHSVQSNLTLINQEIIDAFKILGIESVGTSFEIIPHIRGFGKKRDSVAYNKKFFEGVNLLEENGLRWGVIYVVHKQSLKDPLGIFNTLANLNVASGPQLNKIYIYDEDKYNLAITGKEYADFLGAIM